VIQACDATDGVTDGIISSPAKCHFDPSILQCKAQDAPDCLTAPQVAALRAIYQGPRNPRTGQSIFPGFEPGSEAMFPIQTSGPEPFGAAFTYMKDLVFKDAHWDFRSFDYDKDVTRALQAGGTQLDVASDGLDSFFSGGRKLLLSHGWADGLIPPMNTVNFYTALTTHLGPQRAQDTRLFMIPGMGHCAGGDGPFVFDAITTLDNWVETGHAPERIVVSNPPGAPTRTRPLCPYPQEAVYSGAGSTDDEKSFRCASSGASGPSAAQSSSDQGKVLGLAFVGRMVSDLDRSVAFYKAIGFSQDPAANSAWREDDVIERLYGVSGIQTRMAKMYVNNTSSGRRFVVYLRELKGLPRKNLSDHTAWDPGVTHFGLIVPDADAVWQRLRAEGMLKARSWGAKLIAPPGQTKGLLAYMTDPDGLDIELIGERPAAPAENGRPARPALLPGVSHVGVVILDSDKEKAFYGTLFGGQLQSNESPWLKGDFYDSAVGGHGNILRFFNESFPEAAAPSSQLYLELVEFQNRKKPVEPAQITDIGVGYVGFQVQNLDAFLQRVEAAGAQPVSNSGIVTMRGGTREVMVRDPDVGMFVELFETKSSP
jgi:catechol 2,3-dioxygenase-like lactoylglutathione lyase family enzyme